MNTATQAPVTLADFKTWLKDRQQAAAEGMSVTTGAPFKEHLDTVINVMEAQSAVNKFEREGGAA